MKKMLIMLVVMFVAVANAAAQMVVKETPVTFTLVNGYVYDRTHVPGGTWVRAGEDVNSGINRYFMDLRGRNAAEAQRQYNAFIMSGGLNGITPVDIVSTTVMGGGMMMGGGAGMMMGGGTGAAMGGMVMGSGGMAGANSNVIIDNQNMMSTVGSGLNMYYDTGSNSLSMSGDPLMAAGRLLNFIGGSKKRQQTTTNNANNGNVRVIYVDAATGQQVQPTRRSTATTPTTRTTTTTTTRSTNNATSYTGYNFASGF